MVGKRFHLCCYWYMCNKQSLFWMGREGTASICSSGCVCWTSQSHNMIFGKNFVDKVACVHCESDYCCLDGIADWGYLEDIWRDMASYYFAQTWHIVAYNNLWLTARNWMNSAEVVNALLRKGSVLVALNELWDCSLKQSFLKSNSVSNYMLINNLPSRAIC